MSLTIWICIFFPLIVAETEEFERRRIIAWLMAKRMKMKRGVGGMSEAVKRFLGKKCMITTINNGFSSSELAEVSAVEDNWLILKTKKGEAIVNTEFIVKIQEHVGKKSDR